MKIETMKIIITSILAMFLFSGLVMAQEDISPSPFVEQMAAPIYPFAAIPIHLEANIIAKMKIDGEGKVSLIDFDKGDKIFHIVIKNVMKEWKFEKSSKKERDVSVNFIFTLLAYDSQNYPSVVFKSPNSVQVFAKRIKELDSTDY